MSDNGLRMERLQLASGREQIVYRGGDGPPLVWLHGLDAVSGDDPFVRLLCERHSVLAPLAPGFDDLAELDEIRDVHDLALHYDDILEAAGLDEAVLVGHSFGALIGAELAAHVPRRVERLMLISPLGLWNEDYPVADLFALTYADMPTLLYADGAAPAQPVVESGEKTEDYVEALNRERDDAAVEALVDLARSLTTVAKFVWPIPDRGLGRRLYRITARTMIVMGAEDRFVPPRYAQDYASGIANAEQQIIPDVGHMIPTESPNALNDILNAFLEEHELVV